MPDKTRVTLAAPYTDSSGKDHKADATITLDFFEARTLLNEGRARPADDKGASASKEA